MTKSDAKFAFGKINQTRLKNIITRHSTNELRVRYFFRSLFVDKTWDWTEKLIVISRQRQKHIRWSLHWKPIEILLNFIKETEILAERYTRDSNRGKDSKHTSLSR